MDNLKKLKLSQIYATSSIETGSELYYVIELGKYLNKAGYALSLSGIQLSPTLMKCRFWEYLKLAIQNSWIVDISSETSSVGFMQGSDINLWSSAHVRNVMVYECEDVSKPVIPSDSASRNSNKYYAAVTPYPVPCKFVESHGNWVWNYEEQGMLKSNLYDPMSQNLVSIIAYCAVRKALTEVPKKLTLVLNNSKFTTQLSTVDIDILSGMTNALNGWVDIDMGEDDVRRRAERGYEAWYYIGVEKGMLDAHQDGYTIEEKMNRFDTLGFKSGDVVGLYYRVEKDGVSNKMKPITEFHYAIVRAKMANGLLIEQINEITTPFMRREKYKNLSMQLKSLYIGEPKYDEFNSNTEVISWYNLGVEYCMCNESKFIAPLYHVDGDDNCILIAMSKDEEWLLPQEEAIYWLLKLYNVDFNEAHYKAVHFGSETPLYDKYIQSKNAECANKE